MTETPAEFFVYMLRCADGTYYVGSTADVAARVAVHNAGRGPAFAPAAA